MMWCCRSVSTKTAPQRPVVLRPPCIPVWDLSLEGGDLSQFCFSLDELFRCFCFVLFPPVFVTRPSSFPPVFCRIIVLLSHCFVLLSWFFYFFYFSLLGGFSGLVCFRFGFSTLPLSVFLVRAFCSVVVFGVHNHHANMTQVTIFFFFLNSFKPFDV